MLKRIYYRPYAWMAAQQRWFARRFTPAGQVVMVGAVVSAAVGLDTTLNVAHLAFVLLGVLLVVAVIACRWRPPQLDAERSLPRFGTVGTPLSYTLRLLNRGQRAERGLTLFENFPDPRPTQYEFLHTREPGEERRNIVDRMFAYYRWLWLVSLKTVALTREAPVDQCPPNGSVSLLQELMPLRRGILRFEGVTIGAPDPFGLYRSLRTRKLPQAVLILPKRYWLPPLALPGTRKYQRGGVAQASSVGESDEFVSLRDYRPGDPLKHIHWRSWARVGKPIVKEFQDEYFVRHALVLDTFGSLERQAVFEEAVSVAASFACTLQTQESLLDLMFVGTEAYCFTMGRGLSHMEQMLEVLAGVNLCPDRPFTTLRDLVWRHLDNISGCVFILIQWDHERIELLRQLQSMGIPIRVFVVAETNELKLIEASLHGPQGVPAHLLEVGKVQECLAKVSS